MELGFAPDSASPGIPIPRRGRVAIIVIDILVIVERVGVVRYHIEIREIIAYRCLENTLQKQLWMALPSLGSQWAIEQQATYPNLGQRIGSFLIAGVTTLSISP